MMKNKKNVIVLLALLIFLYCIISIIYSIPKGNKFKKTIFIGDFTKIEVKDKMLNIYNDNCSLRKQDLNFYFNKNIISGYVLTEDSGSNGGQYTYNGYTKDSILLDFSDAFIGFTPDLDIKFKSVDYSITKNINEVLNYFVINNITVLDSTIVEGIVISSFDLDDDGTDELIYSIGLITDNSRYESYVIMMKDNKYYLIYNDDSDYDGVNAIRLKFIYLADFNNDGNYEFVVKKSMSEYGPDYYELYNFDGTKFTKIGGE